MKIENYLISLDKPTLNRFEQFISSKYFNQDSQLIELFNFILKKKSNTKLTYSDLLFRMKWSKSKLAKKGNSLLALYIDFIVNEHLKKNSPTLDLLKYQALKNALTPNSYELKKLKEKIEYQNFESGENIAISYVYAKSLINEQKSYPSLNKLQNMILSKASKIAKYESQTLDLNIAFFAHMGYEYEVLNIHNESNSILLWLLKKITNLFKNELPLDHIFHCLVMISDHQLIPSKHIKDSLDYLLNYATADLNRGKLNLYPIIYKLYKFGLNSRLLDVTLSDYRNIAYVSCKAKEFNWALKFVEEYKSSLPIDQQESAYSFTKARTQWYAKDYDAVIETLRNVEYEDILYNLQTRSYLLTCYYELDEDEALDSLIKSFKVYLRRKRNVSVKRKDAYYGFTSVIDHLMKCRERSDPKRIAKARELLKENPSIPNQDWLLEKIEELETSLGVKRPDADSE